MQQITKSISANITDVDTKKGVTTGYFSTFDVEDTDKDIVMKGAFLKSINENGPQGTGRIKHLLDHHKLIGKLTTLKEDNKGLYYESQITKAPRGLDFLIMCEEGLIMEHSFMGYALKHDKNPKYAEKELYGGGLIYREIMLKEGSTMELWGANPEAKMVAIKGEGDALAALEKAIKIGSLSDETLERLEAIFKSVTGNKTTQPPQSGTVPSVDGTQLINFFKTLTV